jgi:FkbM family methyltransferase
VTPPPQEAGTVLATVRLLSMPMLDASSLAFSVRKAQSRPQGTGIWGMSADIRSAVSGALGRDDRASSTGSLAMLLNLTLSAFRNLVGLLPLKVGVDRGSRLLVPILDPLFGRFQEHEIRIRQLNLSVGSESPQERALAYFCPNIIYKFEQTPLSKLMRILHTDDSREDIFIDIGAHFGMYSLLAREIGYRTVLFEPEKACFNFLKKNSALGETYEIALSNRDDDADFFIARSLGASSLVSPGNDWKVGGYVGKCRVRVRHAGTIIKEVVEDVNKIRLIKIDVEGEEDNVVEGLHDLLRTISPVIWCEVRGPTSDRNPNSCFRIKEELRRLGYGCYCYDGGKIRVFGDNERAPRVFDLLFSKSELKV